MRTFCPSEQSLIQLQWYPIGHAFKGPTTLLLSPPDETLQGPFNIPVYTR